MKIVILSLLILKPLTRSDVIHLLLHFLVPLIIARVAFKDDWRMAYLLMMATMLVDLDHLLATPIYDATRCSIGFHPLHTLLPIAFYLALCFTPKMPKVRYIGIGLVIHMILDAIDCQVTNGVWGSFS